jgi:Tol biopolymer transport system component
LEKLAQDKEIAVPLPTRFLTDMILRGAGIPYFSSMESYLFGERAIASFSPDGKHLAFTNGKAAVFIIWLGEHISNVEDTIPLTSLVSQEGVFVEDLHWSPDAKWLTFTELHYHPPQPTGLDIGPHAGPLDYTYLVRMYSWKDRTTETIAVGRGAFLMPQIKEKTDQTTKEQAK